MREPDIQCEIASFTVYIACKRMFAINRLARRIHEGRKQLLKRFKPGHPSKAGIIAISLSRIFNPGETPLPMRDEVEGQQFLASWLNAAAGQARRWWTPLLDHGIATAVMFYAVSQFDNSETGALEGGAFFVTHGTKHPVTDGLEEAIDRARQRYK